MSEKDSKSRRPAGSRAAEKLFETVNNEQNLENTLYILCAWQNVLSCIRTVFSDGSDFKEQPTVINRNFLDHGMMSKPVRRKDCKRFNIAMMIIAIIAMLAAIA